MNARKIIGGCWITSRLVQRSPISISICADSEEKGVK